MIRVVTILLTIVIINASIAAESLTGGALLYDHCRYGRDFKPETDELFKHNPFTSGMLVSQCSTIIRATAHILEGGTCKLPPGAPLDTTEMQEDIYHYLGSRRNSFGEMGYYDWLQKAFKDLYGC